MTVSRFSLSAVQLHMGMWAMITCHRHSPLQKNSKEQRNNFAVDKENGKYI